LPLGRQEIEEDFTGDVEAPLWSLDAPQLGLDLTRQKDAAHSGTLLLGESNKSICP